MTINELADAVETRDDFVHFVYRLMDEVHQEPLPVYWQNPDLYTYFGALANWTDERLDRLIAQKWVPDLTTEPSWRLFARILLAATMWE